MYEHIFDIQFSFLYFRFKIDGHFHIFSLPFCCLSTSKMILKLTHEQHITSNQFNEGKLEHINLVHFTWMSIYSVPSNKNTIQCQFEWQKFKLTQFRRLRLSSTLEGLATSKHAYVPSEILKLQRVTTNKSSQKVN